MSRGLTAEAMQGHAAAWADLAARALEPNVFNDPGFMLPAALYLAGRRRPRFLVAWDPRAPARMLGVCCLAPPWPGLPRSAWLHPQATAAFPLLDAARAEEALAGLIAQTRRWLGPAGMVMHGMPSDGATVRLLALDRPHGAVTLAERSRAVLIAAPPRLEGRSGKEFRRQGRRLAEQGRVSVTSARGGHVAPALETFLALEAQGWKGRAGTALSQDRGRLDFTRAMVSALARDGRARIDALAVDGEPVAMGVVLRSGPNAFFWKTAFDERFARFSPGAHLTEAIGHMQAGEAGVTMTDSCAVPGHAMIDRLWPERMTVVDVFVSQGAAPDPAARFALAVERERRRRRAQVIRLRDHYRMFRLDRRDAP